MQNWFSAGTGGGGGDDNQNSLPKALSSSSSSLLADWNSYAATKASEGSTTSRFDIESAVRSANDTVSGTFNVVSRGVSNIPGNLQSATSNIPSGKSLMYFGLLLAAGVFFIFMAFTVFLPVIVILPQKFALCFTVGCGFIIGAFFMLKGPQNQFIHMTSTERLPFTLGFIGSMIGTIYVSMVLHSYILSVFFAVIQDGEGSKMGEIYEKMDNMLGEIKDVMVNVNHRYSDYYSRVEKIVLARWEKMTIPLHCLGFALSPRFYDRNYLEEMAPGGVRRKAPNLDKEVVVGVMEYFKRIAESEEEERVLREQFARFHMKKGLYAMAGARMDAVTMDAIDWWSSYGSETPELAEVAKKVLSQPISSSSAERNWSTYSYIHNVKRNRLNSKTADKLVFIHSNIRLQSRFSESYIAGPHKKWDVNPESTYLEGSSTRLEEMQWQNLEDVGQAADDGNGKRQRKE